MGPCLCLWEGGGGQEPSPPDEVSRRVILSSPPGLLLLPAGIRLPGSLTPSNRLSQVRRIGLGKDRIVTEMPFISQNLGN